MTKNAMMAEITMVPVTAMPQAAASASEVLNTTTSSTTPVSSSQFMRGT